MATNPTTPSSTSKAHEQAAKTAWGANKKQNTTAQAALAQKYTKNPHPGPNSLKKK